MNPTARALTARLLTEAEGFLMLDLPRRSLQILEGRSEWSPLWFEAHFLKGEALRCLDRHLEALAPLESAARMQPRDARVALALGWCYKRTDRLDRAIGALERALHARADEALLHYNLACYLSLAGNVPRALKELSTALAREGRLRGLLVDEADFDRLRGTPEFDRLVLGAAPRPGT